MSERGSARRPSMVDVAREAGVAHVTVSRVLNGHPSVRPQTRERVLAAIERLGYRRNDVARRKRRPTAVFAGNDQMAMGVLAAFAEEGVAVPGDVSLVGFDDILGSEYLVPSLTTVRQDFVTLGRTSIEVLVGMIGGTPPRHHLIAPNLIVRSSTAPPPR